MNENEICSIEIYKEYINNILALLENNKLYEVAFQLGQFYSFLNEIQDELECKSWEKEQGKLNDRMQKI